MNKLANFILSTTAKMTAICSIAVVACLFVTIQVNDYLKWTTENLTYQSWVASDALNICKLAEEKCVAEIALTRSDKPFWENIPVKDDCIRIEIGKTICKMNEPVDFSNSPTAKRRMMIDLGIVFLVPFIFVYALKSFFYIKHIGWRRIILTTACCITVITYYYYNKTHYTIDELELTIYTLLAFLISISIPFFIFHFVNWIKEGFLDKNEVREKSKKLFIDETEIDFYPLSFKFFVKIIFLVIFYLSMFAVYVLFPNSSSQIFSYALTGALFALMYVGLEKIKKVFKK